MTRLQRVLPALALLAAAPMASAQPLSTGTAELTSFRLQVVDLTPDDGIAPALSISPGGHVFTALQIDARWLTDPSPLFIDQRLQFDTYPSPSPLGDAAATLSVAGVTGSAQRTATGLFASGTGGDGLATQTLSWWETFKTNSQMPDGLPVWTGSFELGAGTAVTLTADYRVSARIAAGYGGAVIATSGLHGFVGTVYAGNLQRDLGTASLGAPGEESVSGALTLTLANPSAQVVPVYFGAHTYVYTEAPSPVPEPASLLMLLSGGVLVAWRVRRHR